MSEHEAPEPTAADATYDRAGVEAKLGFEIAPKFKTHIVDADESRRFYREIATPFDGPSADQMTMEEQMAATIDLHVNRSHQLLGSLWEREQALLRRVLDPEVAQAGEITNLAISNLSLHELSSYGDDPAETDDPYEITKAKLERLVGAGSGEAITLVAPDSFVAYTSGLRGDNEIVFSRKYHFKDGSVTQQRDEMVYGTEDKELIEEESTMGDEELMTFIGNISSLFTHIIESNRRLAVLDTLDDQDLSEALFLNKIDPGIFQSRLGGYRGWEV